LEAKQLLVQALSTVTTVCPDEYPVDVAVISALPGVSVLKDPSANILPAGMVSELWLRDAMLAFVEVSCTGMALIAFEGSPASSTTSTLRMPVSALSKKTLGDVMTRSLDGNPLGITVVSWVGLGDVRPSALAVIIAVPGVVVVVTLAIAYSCPAGIVNASGTAAMLV
jgi:hypothetical protein